MEDLGDYLFDTLCAFLESRSFRTEALIIDVNITNTLTVSSVHNSMCTRAPFEPPSVFREFSSEKVFHEAISYPQCCVTV